METAPVQSASIGIFMPSTTPSYGAVKIWRCSYSVSIHGLVSVAGCDSALESDLSIKPSGTPRAWLERLYNRALVQKSLQVWQSLTKALEEEPEIMKMVLEIGFPSEAWRVFRARKHCSDEAREA